MKYVLSFIGILLLLGFTMPSHKKQDKLSTSTKKTLSYMGSMPR